MERLSCHPGLAGQPASRWVNDAEPTRSLGDDRGALDVTRARRRCDCRRLSVSFHDQCSRCASTESRHALGTVTSRLSHRPHPQDIASYYGSALTSDEPTQPLYSSSQEGAERWAHPSPAGMTLWSWAPARAGTWQA